MNHLNILDSVVMILIWSEKLLFEITSYSLTQNKTNIGVILQSTVSKSVCVYPSLPIGSSPQGHLLHIAPDCSYVLVDLCDPDVS